jgi:uncharacterized membrane protein (UPF0127 family)
VRALLAVVLVAACSEGGSSVDTGGPGASEGGPSAATTAAVDGVQPVGFDLAPARVTNADGSVCELCLWQATAREQRRRGLMGVTDLGPADGMVFVYEEPSTSPYTMRNTPMPLSIAWFDRAGAFVSTLDMEPCLDREGDCPQYLAAAPFTAALELPAGEVAALGIGPGSVVELGAGSGCDPSDGSDPSDPSAPAASD